VDLVEVLVQDRAEQALGPLAQSPLEVDHPHEASRRRFQRGAAHEGDRRQGGRDLGLAGLGEEGRHVGLGRQDDRLGRHQAAGGVVVVAHEAAHVLGLLGLHESEQLGGLGQRQFGDQVGGVIGLHGVQDVGGAGGVQPRQQGDGVVRGQFLGGVGQTLVGQLGGDLDLTGQGQVGEHVRQIGGLEVLHSGQQGRRSLLVGAARQTGDLLGAHRQALAAAQAQRTRGAALDEQPSHLPVHAAVPLDGDVADRHAPGAVAHGDHPVEQFADDEGFDVTLLEAADVDHPRRDDRPRLDGGHP